MKSDLILKKVSIIERSIRRIYEEYRKDPKNLENYTKQDSIILNLQRASEASINLAMHIVTTKKLGLPSIPSDAFTLLEKEGILSPILSSKMKDLISFSKEAVKNLTGINLVKLQRILDTHLVIYFEFTKTIILY
ncbi:type VII toxin-antitoxin system HepT family RNase toxin [Bacillus weihaiensis]|uniref:type VII toxin-antitoxin system HepT family RNase toxin n=1 Tax=Bacillus weihaiensis TaxID=1547283 RepID=UPI0023574C2D|nr:HepT-like ribonuclease domain-containing protein [Bacillus weihaiensis]